LKYLWPTIGLLLVVDAVGSIIVQWEDSFFPFQVGRIFRVVVGIALAVQYRRNVGSDCTE
jgi:hypothetical protein